jgi:hypothetical protein
MDKTIYPDWTFIDWDGNPELGLKCYRKSFGHGHVSVGVGEFTNIVYSYGPNSRSSLSSTRWRKDHVITEQEAMRCVDSNGGRYSSKNPC